MQEYTKKAVVIHSGGMDSSLCLALAMREFKKEEIISISFSYQQRHSTELVQAKKICQEWNIDHIVLQIDCLHAITTNALVDHHLQIVHNAQEAPNTLVVGRNGLMARLGAIHAQHLGAHYLYMGVIEVDGSNSGYRDCSRAYMDCKQNILRLDLADPLFEIRTPLVFLSKKETLAIAHDLGVLPFLLNETVSCYEGIPKQGCGGCPACQLRNAGILQFLQEHPDFSMPYIVSG